MISIEEKAKEYSKRIKLSVDEYAEAKKIINEINNLVYANSNKKLSLESKKKIVKKIKKELVETKKTSSGYLYKEADNKEYLDLVSYLMQKVSEGGE